MSRSRLWILLAVLCAPAVGAAQTRRPLTEGERVQVVHRCAIEHDQVTRCGEGRATRVSVGLLHAAEVDTLRIRDRSSGAVVAIPRAAVAEVWVADGTRSNFWAGAGFGLLGGAVIGGLIASTQEFCILSCAPATPFGVIIGAPAGFLLGGIIGASIHSDRWRLASAAGLRVTLRPGRHTMGLGLSVAF